MVKPKTTLAAALAALFPVSSKAISEKLSAEEYTAFETEVQEAQNRLDAQAEGNQAVANDLTAATANLAVAQTALTTAQTDAQTAQDALATANNTIAELKPKATQWDAYKAALAASSVTEDSTNVKPGKTQATNGLSAKDQAHLDEKARLKAMYPGLMADIDVPVQE